MYLNMDINDKTELLLHVNTNRDSNHYIHWNNIGLNANISGYCQCGDLFIFIGDNANCKSILKTLYMNEHEERELDVSFNGRIYRNPLVHSSYISISDIENLYDNLTVIETLKFTESMRSIARKNYEYDENTRIDHMINILKVDSIYLNKYVCDLNNIEKWKLILACEILADMNILYIEDPTQNLNDEEKYELLSILRQFSLEGRFIFINLININDIFSQKKYLDLISRIQILSSTGSYIFGNITCISVYLAKYGLSKSDSFSNTTFSKVLIENNQQEFYGKEKDNFFSKPSTSLITWHFENSKELNNKEYIIKEVKDINNDLSISCYISIFYYCLIRALRTRFRDYRQLIILNGFSGIIASGGLLFTFYDQKNDLYGFQNVQAFLSICPYGVILLGNIWYHSDYMDRKLFMYERTKKYLNHTFIFPISTVIADILVMRILPVFISTSLVYDSVGLNPLMSSRINYLVTMIFLMVATSYFSRCVAIWFIFWFDLDGKAIAMTFVTGVLCLWTLYAGFVLNLDSIPSTKYFARDFSLFYWGCNNLYYGENDGKDYVLATFTGNSSFNPFKSTDIYIPDIPAICKKVPEWCFYCLNGTDKIIHPDYPCYIEKEADLCVDSSPIHNSSLCNGNNATDVLAVPGDTLLNYLGIHELGQIYCYSILLYFALFYFFCAYTMYLVLNRKWTHKEIMKIKKKFNIN